MAVRGVRRQLPPEVAARLSSLGPLRPEGNGYKAHCPAHDDSSPSLTASISEQSGKLLLHCHAGCEQVDVLAALDATPQMLDPNREERREQPAGEWTPRGPAVAVYRYEDEQGTLLFEVLRTADKQFPQRRPKAGGGHTWSLGDTRRVLYRLPQVLEALAAGETVWIAEGEKDVHSLEAAGVVATCSPAGAGKWRPEYAEHFTDGAHVVVVADNDRPGQAHARTVATSLSARGARVQIREAKVGKDVTDHLRAGLSLDDLLVTHQPEEAAKPDLALDVWDYIAQDDGEVKWLVPELIQRSEAIMITAFEGYAKSTFLRQLAVALAAGLDPFDGKPIEPSRVLFVDCENSERRTRRSLRQILPVPELYGSAVDRQMLFPIVKPEGIDLATEEDSDWLLERVTAHKPDALIIGPVYRLLTEDANTDLAIRKIIKALDRARIAADCAVILEAHAGHGNGSENRSTRPLGSSMWMRWVDGGIGLAPFKETDTAAKTPLLLDYWKPIRERELRNWPGVIRHGARRDGAHQEWPWVPDDLYNADGSMVIA